MSAVSTTLPFTTAEQCAVWSVLNRATCCCAQVFDELRGHMFGNPHSANPSSSMTGDKVEEVREHEHS